MRGNEIGVNHLFVTQDFAPDIGGMARRHVELCRRFGDGDATTMAVSTVASARAAEFDTGESYRIHRQRFPFREANRLTNQMKWGRWLTAFCRRNTDVIHCGNIRPAGYAVHWAHVRLGVPYLLYVNGGDLLKERRKAATSRIKFAGARRIFGSAAGIVATSTWVAELAGEVMDEIGVSFVPPVGAFDLGTDPGWFRPGRDTRQLRARWRVGDSPLIITVARIVPHKGQDMGIRALAALGGEFPDLRYIIVGSGHDEARLRGLARELGVGERVVFAGILRDDELPEAYATSTVYLGASRLESDIDAEGFGISFIEAASSGLPVVAGDSGGVRSAVRDGETGFVVPPSDIAAITGALATFLRDPAMRSETGRIGRSTVETHYNWDRVARDTREFTNAVVGGTARASSLPVRRGRPSPK